MMRGSILYEVDNLTLAAGTGIATYARNIVQSARQMGYGVDAVFGVKRKLSSRDRRLNEILAFDLPPDAAPRWRAALGSGLHPFQSIFGLSPIELFLSGLVVGPVTEKFRPFDRLFAYTDLIDRAVTHFWVYEKLARLKPPTQPCIFHATQAIPLAVKGCANVYTIHDLVPLRLPYATRDNKRYFYRLLKTIAKSADHIVTVSEHSRRDIIEFLGIDESRVTNTYQPVEIPERLLARSADQVAADLERSFGLTPGEYFLFYGAIEPKKNVARLVDAYAASGTDRPLVVVSSAGWQNQLDLKRLADHRFSELRLDGNLLTRHRRIRRFDYLPEDRLVSLIRGARALLFPSIYEGFGLPVVESMLLGTPVVTSNSTSLAEISGDAALLVDPYSVDDIAGAIRTIDADADLRRALGEKGRVQAEKFRRQAHDERLSQVYQRL